MSLFAVQRVLLEMLEQFVQYNTMVVSNVSCVVCSVCLEGGDECEQQ